MESENKSLRAIFKDYEETKTNEHLLLERLEKAAQVEMKFELQVDDLTNSNNNLQKELDEKQQSLKELERQCKKLEIAAELNANHVDTKVRLLTEALNKRNDDLKEQETNNEELVKLLEKCDQKLLKLDEDYQLWKIKAEKYEEQLNRDHPNFPKIDIDTIDGRISFMVKILEEYRQMLEDDSQMAKESKTILLLYFRRS